MKIFQSTLPAGESTHVIKKEAWAPTTGKPVEDLQGPNASFTVSVADALTGVKDRKGRRKFRVQGSRGGFAAFF
jgi:hypothetical protein